MDSIVFLFVVAVVAVGFGYIGEQLRGVIRGRTELYPEATDEQLLELRNSRAKYARSCARSGYNGVAAAARREVRRYDRALRRRGIVYDISAGLTTEKLTDPTAAWDRAFHDLERGDMLP